MTSINVPSNVTNQELIDWVTDAVELCKPDSVYWCDGSQEEYDLLMASKKTAEAQEVEQ